ncbi:glycoside hydrolase family 97 catalytic domain-containing protein [Mucilaginibacter sp. PAMB04274]|uniref:glycoside hydrolase family 97 protein n=1 Tax=Mucilaginibacter sp. PAMB04274 TaxID=3138568 RepID=UPI0031F71ECE
MKKLQLLSITVLLLSMLKTASAQPFQVRSPNQQILVRVGLDDKRLYYEVSYKGSPIILKSKLGLIREDADFSKGLVFENVPKELMVIDRYNLATAKKRNITYKATRQFFHLKNQEGKLMDVIFQVSDDGVAFRYYFPERSTDVKKITEELTTYKFSTNSKGFLQPMSDAKTGWSQTNPSYEEYYEQGIPVGKPSPIKAGWVYPALFQSGSNWALISETFPEGNYCGTRLKAESPDGEYVIGFPQPAEAFTGGNLGPESRLPWYTPWRIITIGSLKTITESTMGTNVAPPAVKADVSFVKPGQASWSWVILKDDSTKYSVQKRFIDYAAQMHWAYCLIDADWDRKIGYEKIKELADYAKIKNVGIILWYNSAGAWNTAPYTPRNKMLTHESRVQEFARLQKMGIKGVKVDFFGGDGQSMMQYYIDILKDALTHKLQVNFHGATLPRGLQRTYPNLVTAEAIKGMEFATFEQRNQDIQAQHCATIPFTRNVFDPMDFTPMVFGEIPRIKRKTTNAFQLALPVLFLSGIQHMAETDQSMQKAPEYVKNFLRNLPAHWDEVKFIDGYPGKLAIIARKSGNRWIIAGINGENTEKSLKLNLSAFKYFTKRALINDGSEEFSFSTTPVNSGATQTVKIKGNGGFVMTLEK